MLDLTNPTDKKPWYGGFSTTIVPPPINESKTGEAFRRRRSIVFVEANKNRSAGCYRRPDSGLGTSLSGYLGGGGIRLASFPASSSLGCVLTNAGGIGQPEKVVAGADISGGYRLRHDRSCREDRGGRRPARDPARSRGGAEGAPEGRSTSRAGRGRSCAPAWRLLSGVALQAASRRRVLVTLTWRIPSAVTVGGGSRLGACGRTSFPRARSFGPSLVVQ